MSERASAEAHLTQWTIRLLDSYLKTKDIILSDIERVENELMLKDVVLFYLNLTFDDELDDVLHERIIKSHGIARDIIEDIVKHIRLDDLLGDPYSRQTYLDTIAACFKG